MDYKKLCIMLIFFEFIINTVHTLYSWRRPVASLTRPRPRPASRASADVRVCANDGHGPQLRPDQRVPTAEEGALLASLQVRGAREQHAHGPTHKLDPDGPPPLERVSG